jgi:Skp family chaperone for outer membrane proteins
MSDRDDMLLEALTGLINANNKQLNERLDKLENKVDNFENKISQEISGIKLYIENVLEKKLNAFYDNTVTLAEYNALKKEVEELKQTVDNILKKIS